MSYIGEKALMPYVTIQIKEMLEHKYYLSEPFGDVGEAYAVEDWVNHKYDLIENRTYSDRFRDVFENHLPQILDVCKKECGGLENCVGYKNCKLTMKTIHDVLEDL